MPIKNILVVDDSPTDRQYLSDMLAKSGYQVSAAESAEEALAKVKQQRPDLVLMDVVMPGQNGFQATRTLSRDEQHQAHPGDHLHHQGPGNRPSLGHAPGRARLHRQAGEPGRPAGQDLGARIMAENSPCGNTSASFRRACKRGRRPAASKLGLQVGDDRWLVDLADAGEVIPVPPITAVPLTRPWFAGVANIRGNLYSVVDFAAFLGGAPVTFTDQTAPAADQ